MLDICQIFSSIFHEGLNFIVVVPVSGGDSLKATVLLSLITTISVKLVINLHQQVKSSFRVPMVGIQGSEAFSTFELAILLLTFFHIDVRTKYKTFLLGCRHTAIARSVTDHPNSNLPLCRIFLIFLRRDVYSRDDAAKFSRTIEEWFTSDSGCGGCC